MKRYYVFALVVTLVVAAIGAASFIVPTGSLSTTLAPGQCSSALGVFKTNLASQTFGEVTTYQLPKPLRAPNSITMGANGTVWFGEVALRGVAQLYENGTLLEYPWPPSITSGVACYDLQEIWGLVMWKGMVWASNSAGDQLVGLNPSTDTFQTLQLAHGSQPRYLLVDGSGNLWFTESSVPAEIGVVNATTESVEYFRVPAVTGDFAASILFSNSRLAYTVAVNPDDELGQVFSFDPLNPSSTFQQVGGNETLLAPYSVASADGGLWVGQHDASTVAFLNLTSSQWSFYPTSLNPDVPLTLPYYLIANGSGVWFNEHDSNRVGYIDYATNSLTEYNVSQLSLKQEGIGNMLTIGLDRNLVWFTEWTGNKVGFVNASLTPSFSVRSDANSTLNEIPQGSSARYLVGVTGTSSVPLTIQFADSEDHTAVPTHIFFQTNATTISSLDGTRSLALTVGVASSTPTGRYLLLVTVTDGLTSSSVYIPLLVTTA